MDDVHVVAEEGRRQTVGGCVTGGVTENKELSSSRLDVGSCHLVSRADRQS